MTVNRTAHAVPLLLCLCAVMTGPALAGQIVGITFSHSLYSVNPLTGNTTLLLVGCPPPGCGPDMGASASPDAGSIFYTSIVNAREINLTTFQDTPLGGVFNPIDLAFDRSTNTLYDTSGSALFSVHCPSQPGMCTETQIGLAFPTSHMQALDFVPGVGLYGVGDNNLYLINPLSGVAALIGFTGISPDPIGQTNVTDIAYDPGTGRLIASLGCVKQLGPGLLGSGGPCDESHSGSIYWIDRSSGHATLLNSNAPQLMGLAEVVPEPGSAMQFVSGLGALLVWSLRRRPRGF
jgi:hypothetical protein